MELAREFHAAIKQLRKWGKKVTLIHHDDADGISSASIIYESLGREGFKVKTFCLEKLFPEVVETLHSKKGNIYFYVDIGSAHGDIISRFNKGKNLTIILDHHVATKSEDTLVFNLNPELFGISGEKECSGGSVCYLFSKELNKANVDLSYLALVASQEIPGELKGVNKEIANESVKNGLVEIKGKGYYIKKFGMNVGDVFSKLQILGPVGYYRGGPELGIKACLQGFNEEINERIKKLELVRKNTNKKLLARIYREKLKLTENLQWFHASDIFEGMGTKVLGTFCSFLSFQRIVDQKKYLVGFMDMNSFIPGFGNLKRELVKVSARAPKLLQRSIAAKKSLPLSYLLPEACKIVGGFGDGHAVAASGIIPKGKEEEFTEAMQGLI
ncbi:MAG: DHH family phosphoesterase [Candidatus Aenigmarchaeota archaeon]|nr:DHH family phosphoesterase [Candidatus Aenigmarchaeota archaeon]